MHAHPVAHGATNEQWESFGRSLHDQLHQRSPITQARTELTVVALDDMVTKALSSLYAELQEAHWYRREQELVNLFAFGHLTRLFQSSFDIRQLTIEGRVPQWTPNKQGACRGMKDLVIWRSPLSTFWRGDRPFAVMEWKLSTAIRTSPSILSGHARDIQWLKDNCDLMD